MANTERDGHRVAFNLAFNDKNINWHWDKNLYGELLKIAGGKERIEYYQEYFIGNNTLNERQIIELHATKTKHYLKLLQSGKIKLRNGIKRIVNQAQKNGIRLAIATTTTAINVTTLLNSTLGNGAEKVFDVIAAGDVVVNKKPAPDIYKYTLTCLGLKAEECVAFEDSSIGLTSAVAAGIKTIVVTNLYTKRQEFSNAEAVYTNFCDINTMTIKQLIGAYHV
ncbi:MAG: HAD-IA family hydrolase [Alcanivoracaceae bacterium]|nr:HAD-IA family hydrolase [Alcanivoracaceae bacterium]